MTNAMYLGSVPVLKQMLGSLSGLLTKAAEHAAARKIEPDALLQARLFPDMFPLLQQVRVACEFAQGIAARLAGVEVPGTEPGEPSFADLQARVAKTLAFVDSLSPEQFEGSAARDIVLRPGTPKEKRLSGQTYLLNYGLPQFFFHVTTAYALLRHNGVEVGKKDYMGSY